MEAVLSKFKILSCTNNEKNGKTGDSEADRSSSKLHKSHKNGPNSPKLPSKDLSIICLSLLCFWSLGFHQKRSRSAYIFSIRAFFLSMRLTGLLDVTWSTIARSLRHSGNLPPSGSEHSVHLTVTKRAKTSPEQSSSFPSWSDFAPFLKPFHFRFRLSRAFKTTMHCAHSRKEAVT